MKNLGFVFMLICAAICTSNAQLSPDDKCDNSGQLTCQCGCGNEHCGLSCQDRVIYGCKEIHAGGARTSGIYNMTIGNRDVLECTRTRVLVFCDMCLTTGKAWTVIQRRIDGLLSFYQPWVTYEAGFGEPDAEFWLGLRHLASITQAGRWILRIEMTKTLGNNAWAEYDNFKIGDSTTKYKLQSVGEFTGTAGDSLTSQVNSMFSTYNQDNDQWTSYSCALNTYCNGSWWYNMCTRSNLNGAYGLATAYSNMCGKGINWETWGGYTMTLKRVSMLIRPYEATLSLQQRHVMVDIPKHEHEPIAARSIRNEGRRIKQEQVERDAAAMPFYEDAEDEIANFDELRAEEGRSNDEFN